MEKNKIIRLPKLINNYTDDNSDFCAMLYKNKKPLDPNSRRYQLISELLDIERERENEFYDKMPERIKEWEKLLKQHLHVKEYNCQYDETKVSNEYYLFPYELNKANHMIFALYSDFKNDYEGGIKEVAFDIFERLNHNLVIEIVTKEEMLNHAANRVQEVYNRRIRRISEENSIRPILVLN